MVEKMKNLINLWKFRGLSIHGKVNTITAILLLKMILVYPSSVIYTLSKVIKNSITSHFSFYEMGKTRSFDIHCRHLMIKAALK